MATVAGDRVLRIDEAHLSMSLSFKLNLQISLDELDSASGGTGECPYNCMWVCLRRGPYEEGDTREDIDPARAHSDFVSGAIDGGEFF